MGLVFHFRLWVLLLLPVRYLSHHLLFLFFLRSLHMYKWIRHISLNFLPVGFQPAVSRTTYLQSFTHSKLGDQTQDTKCGFAGPSDIGIPTLQMNIYACLYFV